MSTRGSITSRKDKHGRHVSWLVKYDLPRDPDRPKERRQQYETVRGKRSAAQALLNKRLREIDVGEFVNPDSITLREWGDHWLKFVPKPKGAKGRTLQRYGEILALYVYPKLGDTVLQRLRGTAINIAYTELLATGGRGGRPLSARTVNHVHRVLSEVLRAAVKARKVNSNACEEATAPTPNESPAGAFTVDQIARILQATEGSELGVLIRLALVTSARRGELAGLRWSDVDFEARTLSIARSIEKVRKVLGVKVPKSKKSHRTIRLGEAEIAMLRALWKDQAEIALKLGVRLPAEAYLFPAAPDQPTAPVDPDRITQRCAALLTRLGIKRRGLSLHSTRHSAATLLLRAGVDIKTVSARLGHASIKITGDTYAHVLADMDARAGDLASSIINDIGRTKSE